MVNISDMFQLVEPPKLKWKDSIFDALKIVEDQYGMIVVVLDEEGKLSGVVSPGDLRKAILHGHSINTQLDKIVNKQPVCITLEDLEKRSGISNILSDLKQRYGNTSLYAMIPVVTDDRQVMGSISLDSLVGYPSDEKIKSDKGTVLIVGGAGYIGSVLVRILLDNGWGVRVLDKLLYTEDSLEGLDEEKFTFMQGDAAKIDDIVKAVEGVDAVVYLAELVGDPACSLAPQEALKTNYLAVTAMTHLCSHLNINRFIYTSSCSVYGASENPEEFLTEGSPVNPVSLYGRIKALVEEAILGVCNLPNPLFSPTILRLGTVFGHSYRPRFDLVVNTFVKFALEKGMIEVFGGDQWRPNVHVKDVGNAILKVLDSPIENVKGQTFNVGGDAMNYTINDLAELVKDVFPSVEIVKKKNAVDNRNYRVNFSKIENVLGFEANVGLKQGMCEIKDVLEKNGLADIEASEYYNLKKIQELNFQ
mgnify:CR=1 FL=1